MDLDLLDIALRLFAATASGIIIGINRDMANKPVGMRTLGLVSLGCAVVSLAAIQFHDAAATPDALSRVIQGIIQGVLGGIGFIGAGVILRDSNTRTVEGLTTAATVWVTAAFGIACAFAAWKLLAIATVLTLILLFAARVSEKLFPSRDGG